MLNLLYFFTPFCFHTPSFFTFTHHPLLTLLDELCLGWNNGIAYRAHIFLIFFFNLFRMARRYLSPAHTSVTTSPTAAEIGGPSLVYVYIDQKRTKGSGSLSERLPHNRVLCIYRSTKNNCCCVYIDQQRTIGTGRLSLSVYIYITKASLSVYMYIKKGQRQQVASLSLCIYASTVQGTVLLQVCGVECSLAQT